VADEPDGAARPPRAKPPWRAAGLRFAVVGGLGVLVNLAVLEVVHGQLGVLFALASALATEAAIVANYLGNELWTFHIRRLSLRRFAQFNLVALAGLLVTVAVATGAERLVDYRLAQLAGIACGALVNFSVNFRWTWR